LIYAKNLPTKGYGRFIQMVGRIIQMPESKEDIINKKYKNIKLNEIKTGF